MIQYIDQSLYSRVMLGEKDYLGMFFSAHIGQFNRQGEMVELVDTNLYNSSNIHNEFVIRGIRFRETIFDLGVREHLLKYAHFVFRIVDRDYLTYPFHLMDNYYYFLEKKIGCEIAINPYENFQVLLKMKPYEKKFQLTCELLGILSREI